MGRMGEKERILITYYLLPITYYLNLGWGDGENGRWGDGEDWEEWGNGGWGEIIS